MQRVDTTIIKQDQLIDKVYFFFRGKGILQRRFKSVAYGTTTVDAVVLPEGSFYGELSVIVDIPCEFTLKAAPYSNNSMMR